MSACLLDVNALIALLWPRHEGHERMQGWFRRNSSYGWATCPFTESGFVRIVSNPIFSSDSVNPQEAVSILENNFKHPHHRSWQNDLSFIQAVRPFVKKLIGHKQVTDAYLLGLALHRKAKLITLDSAIMDLLPEEAMRRELVVLL